MLQPPKMDSNHNTFKKNKVILFSYIYVFVDNLSSKLKSFSHLVKKGKYQVLEKC